MKKIFTLLLLTAIGYFTQAQTCNPLDVSFGVNGKATGLSTNGNPINVRNLQVQPDGKIIQISNLHNSGFLAVRYHANGSPDNSYGTNSKAVSFSGQNAVAGYGVLQSDGKLVVAGTLYNPNSYADVALTRFNSNGSLDNTFGTGGNVVISTSPYSTEAWGITIQPDGKIVVAGSSSGACFNDCVNRQYCPPLFMLLRLNPDGTTDKNFGQNGVATLGSGPTASGIARSVLIQPDGKMIAFGDVQTYSCNSCVGGATATSSFLMARFLPNGTLDNSFGLNGQVMDAQVVLSAWPAVLQPDGRIAVTVSTGPGGFLTRRYNNNGSVDNSFIQKAIAADWIKDLLLLPNGNLVLAGSTFINGQGKFLLIRLKYNGDFDSSLNGNGQLYFRVGVPANSSEGATGLALQGTQLVVGGYSEGSSANSGNQYNQVVLRLGAAVTLLPVSVMPAGPHYPCTGESLTLSTGLAGNHQWYRDGALITGATDSTYTVTTSGSYFVDVISTVGCGLSNPVLVQYNALPVTITPLNSLNFCNGDSVNLQSNQSGTAQWYKDYVAIPGATDLIYTAKTSGSYHVTIKDTKVCGQSSPVVVNVSSNKPSLQWDGTQLRTVGSYLYYRWYLNGSIITGSTSNILVPATRGLYKVTIADFGCDTTSNEFSLECNHIGPSKPVIRVEGNTFSTSAGYAGYQWYRKDTAISGATAQTYMPVFGQFGAYKVTVINDFGCSNTSDTVSFTPQAHVLGGLFLRVYPNPANEKIVIEMSQPAAQTPTATLYDLHGRKVLQLALKGGSNAVQVHQLPAASYVLEIRYGKEKVVLKAVVVR